MARTTGAQSPSGGGSDSAEILERLTRLEESVKQQHDTLSSISTHCGSARDALQALGPMVQHLTEAVCRLAGMDVERQRNRLTTWGPIVAAALGAGGGLSLLLQHLLSGP